MVTELPSGPTGLVFKMTVVASSPSSVVPRLHSYCLEQHCPSLAGRGSQSLHPVGGRHSCSAQITLPRLQ